MQKPNEDWGCWPYELLQIILDMRTTYDGWKEFLEGFGRDPVVDRDLDAFLDELLPIVNKFNKAAVICGLMAACGRMLEDTLDGYAQSRILDKAPAK